MPAFNVEALIIRQITSERSCRRDLRFLQLPHLRDLNRNELADDDLKGSLPIDVLLGVEVLSSILRGGVRVGGENEPVAQQTSLGWIVSGRSCAQIERDKNNVLVSSMHAKCIDNLNKNLRAFWEIEEVPSKVFLSPDEEECERIFASTTVRLADGKYCVNIPFKTDTPDLGESRNIAFQCYKKLQSRLKNNPELSQQYNAFLQEYLDLGHMAPDSWFKDNPRSRYFLPHHPVIRESSSTTKLRVVFNASARSSNGKSLNDCMHTGAKLHNELTDIILRWRLHRIVCVADIEKMFRQILVSSNHTPFQCIFWQPPGSQDIQIYRLTTVTYGTAAAPYLALRVLHQLADDEATKFPTASVILKRDVYVDDALYGADTVKECREKRDELIALLKSGGFSLRKWESNSDELLSDLPDELKARTGDKLFEENSSVKVLGVKWLRTDDCFSFQTKTPTELNVTKRAILSCIASIFDPLGWVSPTVIVSKIFMQKLWKQQIDWDTRLSEELINEWAAIESDFANLSNIIIPRWLETTNEQKWEIHGFADASTKAYAAAVYLKVQTEQCIKTFLLMSKSRVAPVKELTVPRLELCAAVLLSDLLAYIQGVLDIKTIPNFCWSDSTIVLAWLDACPSRWKRFVANRVSQVQENLPGIVWKHVSTDCNPADLASRGVSANELASNDLWWHGPSWLSYEENSWPTPAESAPDPALLEIKTSSLNARVKRKDDSESLLYRFSDWFKLLRFTARIKCWIAKSKGQEPSLCQLINEATTHWIKIVQEELFSKEITFLTNKKRLTKGPLQSLDPFIDDLGILRVGGRLQNADLPFDEKHPIILGAHYMTTLIVRHVHESDCTLHGGVQLMLRVLREKYWILRARDIVRRCIRHCVTCVRHRAAPMEQQMGNLPRERVTPARAFEKVGVDYAGPFLVRAISGRGRAAHKCYIAVFVCLATRAVHLELVSDYSSKCFLAAFERFVARYGLPTLVMSDNGTTFQGAERELREAFDKITKDVNLKDHFATKGVQWRFIPPAAPHFGGIWEAGVKSTKHHLKRVINNQSLTYEEMHTLLLKISACLNSRPIAPLSDSIDDFESLTPARFLNNAPSLSVPTPSLEFENENCVSRWKRLRQMRDQFWRIWSKDYLLLLQHRRKWKNRSDTVVVGDIVLLRNDLLPPTKWELGRIIECFPDKNGLIRVVKVKTANSIYTRAIHKLCLLPLRSSTSTDEFE